MTTKKAIKVFDRYMSCRGSHPAGFECEVCDALGTLVAAAETGEAVRLAAKYNEALGCQGCPVLEACKKAPAGSRPFGLLMCESAIKYLDLWKDAYRKEVAR